GNPEDPDQAAGGHVHVPQRQQHFPAGRGPAGEPGLRNRPSEFRDEQQLLEPDSGAAGSVEEQGHLQSSGLHAAEKAGRRSSPAAPGKDRREADHVEQGAGRLFGCRGGRSVQAGSLPLLSRRAKIMGGMISAIEKILEQWSTLADSEREELRLLLQDERDSIVPRAGSMASQIMGDRKS